MKSLSLRAYVQPTFVPSITLMYMYVPYAVRGVPQRKREKELLQCDASINVTSKSSVYGIIPSSYIQKELLNSLLVHSSRDKYVYPNLSRAALKLDSAD